MFIIVSNEYVNDTFVTAWFGYLYKPCYIAYWQFRFCFQGPISIVAGIVFGSLWGAMLSVIPEKGDSNVTPLRFLALFLGGLFSLFMSSMIGWSGAGLLNNS